MIIDKKVLPMLQDIFTETVDKGLDGFNTKQLELRDLNSLDSLPKIAQNIKDGIPTRDWLVLHATVLATIVRAKIDDTERIEHLENMVHIMESIVKGTQKRQGYEPTETK